MKRKVTIWGIIAALTLLMAAGPALAKHVREITFAVFSDPHLYHTSLGTEGAAFEAYLARDRKLIRESEAILDAAIDGIISERRVKFVLVPGDLTKDGELFNHFLFALKVLKLKKAGIKVFVIPGNHDINNPHAFRYVGDHEVSIPNVSPRMFKWIYHRCGYGEAIARDSNSLSYVAEPVKGLWLIAMDTCSYAANEIGGAPATEGRFKPQTLDWVLKMIRLGKKRGKQVLGMMHHGLLEHYSGQSQLFPEYVVADWPSVSRDLAQAGLSAVFTGHYHASDITRADFEGGRFLFDIETGSLVTYPCPYRIVTLGPGKDMEVNTEFIDDIDYDTGADYFPEYAESYLTEGLTGIAYQMLQEQYGLPAGEQTLIYAEQLANAFKTHYAGDEYPTMETLVLIGGYLSEPPGSVENLMGQYLGTLWTDLMPGDTNLGIDLITGATLE